MMQHDIDKQIEAVRAKQNGAFGENLPAFFVGGELNGQTVAHCILMMMQNEGYTIRWSQVPGCNQNHINLSLEDQPIIKGYLSPMIDRGMLRYETQEVYDALSD